MASPSQLQTRNPHFFKIVLDDYLTDGKLGIPRKFVREYGDDLPNIVHLKLPNGIEWEVELRKGDREIWLAKGWQEFADYYSLEHGNLLVFEYERNRQFNVLIFDMSATEIDYPVRCQNGTNKPNIGGKFPEPKMEQAKDDVSIEIPDDFSPCQKRKRRRHPLECPLPHKKMRNNSTGKLGSTTDLCTSVLPSATQSCRKELESVTKTRNLKRSTVEAKKGGGGKSIQKPRINEATGRNQTLIAADKARVLCRATNAFKSNNPFFMVVMQPSYIYPGKVMCIPKIFLTKYLKMERESLILCVLGGRTWSMKYGIHNSTKRSSAVFYDGWRKFVQDNCLGVGDVCAFEMINDTVISFKVVIFRADQNENYHNDQCGANPVKGEADEETGAGSQFIQRPSLSRASNASKAANKQAHVPAFFKVVIGLSHLKKSMGVPMSFISQNKMRDSESIMLQVENRWWPVKFCSYPHYQKGYLSAGWHKFAIENSLQVGNICVFELIKRDPMQLKVSIVKGNAKRYRHKEVGNMQHTIQRPSSSRDSRIIKDSNNYASTHSFFKIITSSCHFQNVTVPKKFMLKLEQSAKSVKLQVQNRWWPVKISFYPQHGHAKLSVGWTKFVRDNALKVGDVCVFEIINGHDMLLNVSITRKASD